MFRYIVSLILVNTYYCSSGPVPQNATQSLIAEPLMTLANVCKNSFLVDLIRRNIKHCSGPEPLYSQTELECYMFYEISTRLCSQNYPPEIDLKDSYTKKTQNKEDVLRLCGNANTWKFLNLENYPQQKANLEDALNKTTTCIKLCGVEEVLDVNTNFYCRLFQWGLDELKTRDFTTSHNEIISVPNSENSAQNRTVSTTLKTEQSKSVSEVKNPEPNLLNPEKPLEEKKSNAEISGPATNNNHVSESFVIETKEHNTSSQLPVSSVKSESEKPSAVAEEPPKQEILENFQSKEAEEKKDVIKDPADNDKAKQQQNVELEDEDSEFDNDQGLDDHLSEQEADNGNDQIEESDPKLNVKPKDVEKKIESITSLQQDTVQRESGIFPNPIQDTFSDDDDHFFPFFLTAIILVVLLYILYHNKTKFTKVILGLIVEGRQTGRRRNSRGHSYRRLDTLEQAMSSNTAAPPSKIIY